MISRKSRKLKYLLKKIWLFKIHLFQILSEPSNCVCDTDFCDKETIVLDTSTRVNNTSSRVTDTNTRVIDTSSRDLDPHVRALDPPVLDYWALDPSYLGNTVRVNHIHKEEEEGDEEEEEERGEGEEEEEGEEGGSAHKITVYVKYEDQLKEGSVDSDG